MSTFFKVLPLQIGQDLGMPSNPCHCEEYYALSKNEVKNEFIRSSHGQDSAILGYWHFLTGLQK